MSKDNNRESLLLSRRMQPSECEYCTMQYYRQAQGQDYGTCNTNTNTSNKRKKSKWELTCTFAPDKKNLT